MKQRWNISLYHTQAARNSAVNGFASLYVLTLQQQLGFQRMKQNPVTDELAVVSGPA
jgi:hypothetical protein